MHKSRAIKFRMWDTFNKNWIDGPCEYLQLEVIFDLRESMEGCIVQQFTGFMDQNNVEIYEGDLVNFVVPGITHGPEREEYTNAEVHWDEEYGCWAFGKYKDGLGSPISFSIVGDRIDTESFIVTGNIFQNKK